MGVEGLHPLLEVFRQNVDCRTCFPKGYGIGVDASIVIHSLLHRHFVAIGLFKVTTTVLYLQFNHYSVIFML